MHRHKNAPSGLVRDLHTAMQRLIDLTAAATLMDRMAACMEMVTAESKATLAISQWEGVTHTEARIMLAEITSQLAPHQSPTLEQITEVLDGIGQGILQDV